MATPRSSAKPLSRADEILLVAIYVLGTNAYSTTIRQEVLQRAKKRVSVGSLWVSLDQLASRKLIEKRPVKNESDKGGRPKIFYRVTSRGIQQLKKVQAFQAKLWKDVPVLE